MSIDSVPISGAYGRNPHSIGSNECSPITYAPADAECSNENDSRFQGERRSETALELTQRGNAVNRQPNPHQFARPALLAESDDARTVQNCNVFEARSKTST